METQLTDLDKLYFPHEWQKRYPFDKALEEHVKFFNTETEKAKNSMRCEFDIPYGFGSRQKYNIFGIDLPDDSSIVIHLHGGYWQVKEINHNNQGFLAQSLHKHNIKLIAIGYEVAPETSISDIISGAIEGIKRALDYAIKCKSKGVILSGHSVGAHMVATIFSTINFHSLSSSQQQIIKAAFLSCGLYDLTPLVNTIINQGLQLTEDTAKQLSPLFMQVANPGPVKFHVIVAGNDSPVFIEQSEKIYEKLKGNGVDVDFRVLKDVDHFNAVENIVDEDFEITRLYIQYK